MAYISKIIFFFVSFFLLFEGKAQFMGYQVSNWEVVHHVGIKKSKFVKIFPRHNSPMTLDRLYSFFCPQILEIEESSDSIYIYVSNSDKPLKHIINQNPLSMYDTNYCVFNEKSFLYNDSTFYSGFVWYPLKDVKAFSGKSHFYKRLKINRIDFTSEKCFIVCRFESNQNCYVIVLLHEDYELVNVIKIKKI